MLSTTVNLFECSLATVSSSFVDWQRQVASEFGGEVVISSASEMDIANMARGLFPLQSHVASRYVFFTLNECWCGMLDNGWRGTDAGVRSVLSRELQIRTIRAVSSEERESNSGQIQRYGANIFEFEDGQTGAQRQIYCVNDGGKWVFSQRGSPLPFEDQNSFLSRRVRDRFTRESLCEYLLQMGVPVCQLRLDQQVSSKFVTVNRPVPNGQRFFYENDEDVK